MRNVPDAVMLFAAGFGTRMAPLTDTHPKPLVRVAGKSLLDHALDLSRGACVRRTVVNTHYLAAQIEAHLAGSDVLLSHEEPDILDTGGGLRKALPLLGPGPVFTMNTDAVWTGPNPFDRLREVWDSERMGALLLLVPRERATGHAGQGDFAILPDGRIERGAGLVYSGAQIIDPSGLAQIEQNAFSLNLSWNQMAAEGRLFGVAHTGGWCDVGRPESIALAEGLLAGLPAEAPQS